MRSLHFYDTYRVAESMWSIKHHGCWISYQGYCVWLSVIELRFIDLMSYMLARILWLPVSLLMITTSTSILQPFDGRSTAYQRSLRSQWRNPLAAVTLAYSFIQWLKWWGPEGLSPPVLRFEPPCNSISPPDRIYKVLFYTQITPNELGAEWVWGLLQPGFIRWAPLLHMTTLTVV